MHLVAGTKGGCWKRPGSAFQDVKAVRKLPRCLCRPLYATPEQGQQQLQEQQAWQRQEDRSLLAASRRNVVLALPAFVLLPAFTAAVPAAQANPLQDVARQFVRPEDITSEQAVAALLDARSILRDMKEVVATPLDSQERFYARKMWPAYAKWLREVGPSAPVVSGIIAGTDKEATLSEEYGGKAGQQPGPVDAVYVALGKVLTISGRTIKEEAQQSPAIIAEAQDAIEGVLAKVPQELLDSAQELRRQRASKQA